MKFDWDPEKNEWLKAERKISFEEIALLLSNGILWKRTKHPNQKDYPHQEVFLVPINNYIYFVPYVIDGEMTDTGPRPAHIKDRVRALGPTVRQDLTLKPADPDIGNWVI